MNRPRFSVAVTAKAPIAGFAKTRLIPLLGAAGAARAQREFIVRTLASVAAAVPESTTLWCAPDTDARFFRALRRFETAGSQLRYMQQGPGDIGDRMAQAFAAHGTDKATTCTPLLLVGTDCPMLSPAHLLEAAQALASGADAVLAPVEDGGYALVGLRDARAALGIFSGIDWSTSRVIAQTRDRLRAAGALWHELEPLWDIDEPADWLRWQALRERNESSISPVSAAPSRPAPRRRP